METFTYLIEASTPRTYVSDALPQIGNRPLVEHPLGGSAYKKKKKTLPTAFTRTSRVSRDFTIVLPLDPDKFHISE